MGFTDHDKRLAFDGTIYEGRDWAEAGGRETMLDAAARHLEPTTLANAGPGDVVVFRLRPGVVAKHAAILASASTMVHAMEGAPVCEVSFSTWWRRRVAGVFRFPNISP